MDKKSHKTQVNLTPIALQKLVYIANACMLTETHQQLVSEQPITGEYGPFFRSLTQTMLTYGNDEVECLIPEASHKVLTFCQKDFKQHAREVAEDVFELYYNCNYDHLKLTFLAGGNDYEWSKLCKISGGLKKEISNASIIRFYQGALDKLNCDDDLVIPPIQDNVTSVFANG